MEVQDNSSGIYQIRNLITNKIYIGSTSNLKNRIRDHKSYLRNRTHQNILLQRAYDKYGLNNFEFSILELCSVDKLIELEQSWLDWRQSYNPKFGYNLNPTAGSNLGFKHSYETKEKMSLAAKGKPKSETHKKNISLGKLGHFVSEEARAKISLAGRNRIVSDETRLKLSIAGMGRKPSPETRLKLSFAAKNRNKNERRVSC